MTGHHQVIYVAANVQQAHMLVNLLDEQGIRATVTNESLQGSELPGGFHSAPRVVVEQEDADAARQWAAAFEIAGRGDEASHRSHGSLDLVLILSLYLVACCGIYVSIDVATKDSGWHGAARGATLIGCVAIAAVLIQRWRKSRAAARLVELAAREEDEEPGEEESDWPTCPSCNRPRQTSCPVCETSGSNFPRAFMPDDRSADDSSLCLICSTCDHPFEPNFLARCEWCGYRFDDGVEQREFNHVTSPFEPITARAWLVIAGLVLFGAATIAWFLHIAPRR